MANYFARKAGNIDDVDVWATTPSGTAADVWSTFTSSDVLHSNNFAITVNVSTTVGEVRNDNANSATAGGSFTLNNGITLTANAQAGSTGTACVIFSGTSGNSATLVGNATGGSGNNIAAHGANNTSTGTLNITGNATGGSGAGAFGATNAATGTLTITGNATGGSGTNTFGANNTSTGTLTITGNATGGTGAGAFGARNQVAGTVNITGNVTGAGADGANNASTGTLTIVGSVYASESFAGVSGANRAQQTLLTGPFFTTPSFGVNPIYCLAWRWDTSLVNTTFLEVPTSTVVAGNLVVRELVTPDNATNFPDESDVRSGTTFGISNVLVGTCVIPPAASVATGVPVDNTTGTAALTPADFWDALTSGMTTSGSIGARLKNAATLDSTGQQLADALSPVP
jgi:hypothetical protein